MGRGVGGGQAATASPDFYRLLQLDPDAPRELIAEAYWYLAGRLQVGRQERPGLREQLDALNEAYATLISPERRKIYDATIPRVRKLRRERARAVEKGSRRSWVPLLARRRTPRGLARSIDYYAVLYLDPATEPAIVHRAYSVLRVLHGNGLANADELVEAYAMLADPARRAAYDAFLPMAAESVSRPAVSPPSAAPMALPPTALEATASSAEAQASTPETVTPGPNMRVSAAKAPALVLRAVAAAARPAGRTLWWGLAGGARLSRRFVVWAWPIVRERSRQFAAWAWPIVRTWSRWLAARAWLVTKALARAAARATREAVRHALTWWRERRASAEPIEDWAVRSRLSRGLAGGAHSGSLGEGHLPGAVPQPAARLIVETGAQTGVVLELEGEPVTLGAGEECALRLPSDGGQVAPEHARIWQRQGRFIIRQLGGQPCILVDGRAIPWAVLEDGDRIEIGAHVVRFRLVGPDTEA